MLRTRLRRALTAGTLAVSILATTGCQISQLQFRVDKRLTFDQPKARHKVKVPVAISWSIKDFQVTGLDGTTDKHKGVFAVFVDQPPMPVGKNLKWVARNDSGCKRDPRCPGIQYLHDRNIFVTNKESLTLTELPKADDGVGDEVHYVNVVLLDGSGHRIGESAWYLPFKTTRRSA